MSWTIEFDYQDGSGFQNVTAQVDVQTFRRTETLWQNLKPVINTCTFQMRRNSTTITKLLTTEKEIDVRIQKNSNGYFRGYIRRNFNISLKQTVEPLKIECVDRGYLLDSTIDTNIQYINYTVSNTSTTSTSIIHQLLALVGFSGATVSPANIAKTIDYFVINARETTYREAITTLLFEFGYIWYFDGDGVFQTYDFLPTDTTTTKEFGSTSTNKNMIGKLSVDRRRAEYEGAEVQWWTHEDIADVVVFEDTTGQDDTNRCVISVAASDSYPEGSESHSVYAEYDLQDRDLLNVSNAKLEITKDVEIIVNTFTNYGKRASIRFDNEDTGSAHTITRLKIRGTATFLGPLTKERKLFVASSERYLKYISKHITAQADAQKLANGLARFYQYSDFIYTLKSRTDYNIGDFVDINEDYHLLIDNRCVIVQKIVNERNGEITYTLEGIQAYSTDTVVSEGSTPANSGNAVDKYALTDGLVKPDSGIPGTILIGTVPPLGVDAFNFENSTQTVYSETFWSTVLNTVYSSTSKYLDKAITFDPAVNYDTPNYSYLYKSACFTLGNSQVCGAWVYHNATGTDDYIFQFNGAGGDSMHFGIDGTSIIAVITKTSSTVLNQTITSVISAGWNFIFFLYNASADSLTVFHNGTYTQFTSIGGTWASSGTGDFYLNLYDHDNGPGIGDSSVIVDDLFLGFDTLFNYQTFIDYYNKNYYWSGDLDANLDLIITPGTDGRVKIDLGGTAENMGWFCLLDDASRSGTIDLYDNSISTSWETADLESLVEPGTTALFGFMRIDFGDSASVLLTRPYGSSETDTDKLQTYFSSPYVNVGSPVIIKAPNGKFQYCESNASTEVGAIYFELWGYWRN
jgi:hypothetical protein